MFIAKGWCAGILLFENKVEEQDLPEFMSSTKDQLLAGELKLHFAREVQTATEVCVDVYEENSKLYSHDLSKAYKK